MANDRTITIRITNDTANLEPSADAKGVTKKNDPNDKEASKRKMAVQATALYATTQVVATVMAAAQTSMSRYNALTENYIAETVQQNINAHIGRTANVIGSTLGGAILGAKAGPAGVIIGMAVGFVSAGFRNELSRANTLYEQAKAIHEEAYSLYFNTERAGMINYSRGTEN